MFFLHHLAHQRFSMLSDINQYEVLARNQVVVKLGKLFMLAIDSNQAAFPGAKQSGRSPQDCIDQRWNRISAKRLQVHEQSNARQSDEESQRGADESVANDVQGFEVVAGVDLVPLQPAFVAANDV